MDAADGWRAREEPGARMAVFCRLEHVVPWHIQGPHWEAAAGDDETRDPAGAPEACSHCGARLADVRVLLVRHRGGHRIPDAFCSSDHMAAWARAGGRFR